MDANQGKDHYFQRIIDRKLEGLDTKFLNFKWIFNKIKKRDCPTEEFDMLQRKRKRRKNDPNNNAYEVITLSDPEDDDITLVEADGDIEVLHVRINKINSPSLHDLEAPATVTLDNDDCLEVIHEELELPDSQVTHGVTVASRIMAKMGWRPGDGLGARNQGIKEPIKERGQLPTNKRGLGYY